LTRISECGRQIQERADYFRVFCGQCLLPHRERSRVELYGLGVVASLTHRVRTAFRALGNLQRIRRYLRFIDVNRHTRYGVGFPEPTDRSQHASKPV
jgi:hypothetical protein